MYFNYLILFYFVAQASGQNEGEKCNKYDLEGICTKLEGCPSAIDDIKSRRGSPKICTFVNSEPVVCCIGDAKSNSLDSKNASMCKPVDPWITANKTGQKAWDKCIEYQEKLIYPCEKSVAFTGTFHRTKHCNHKARGLIVGGEEALPKEFPHMVALGYSYDEDESSIEWQCGGTLLSELFILTAGHCTVSPVFGNVKYAHIGILRLSDKNGRLYKIKNIIKHPGYHSPIKYNDIALLEVDKPMLLDQYSVPACLDIGRPNDYSRAVATGWGTTKYLGRTTSNHLQKVVLEKFTTAECKQAIPSSPTLRSSINESTQICYGDKTESKDACQGDSGGPLQIKHEQIICMYTVIGVTSFGRRCGRAGSPGVYTRVEPYVPWIESIVWP